MGKNETIMQVNRDKRAVMDSFKVKRDGEGNLIPIDEPTKYGTVSVLPMSYGDAEAWGEMMGKEKSVSTDDIAKTFAKHIVDPNMSQLQGPEVKRDFLPLAIQELIMAIMTASGMEEEIKAVVNEDGTAKIELTKNV